MQKIINGGMYSVKFAGSSQSEFFGEHPAIIIRTLKEDEIFIVVPLTTYTKEKMKKAKEKGFGYHVKSTNSIARIDKMQILHKRDISKRWVDAKNDLLLILTFDEIKELNDMVNKYIDLSTDKEEKEYEKYYKQYNLTFNYIKQIKLPLVNLTNNIFTLNNIDDQNIELISRKSNFSQISILDLKNMFQIFKDEYSVLIQNNEDTIIVKLIKKC
ncbi:hypothetical protein [Acetivibrio cellulolyticus]|uniref:hypothetical protein n=1 Tax=Acetivibrio cellulolyticus TaxID=35830 RepID=UPI0001E2C28B|nr:hypothetical protein [Acetivibrio cellulolyticus]